MTLKINTNPVSMFSNYQLQKNQNELGGSLERIAAGKRINKAADNAAGMVIADRLEAQALGFGQAFRNANDAISVVQVADGGLEQATSLIQDIRVKAVQASGLAQSAESRQAIQADIDKSLTALGQIAQTTSYNGRDLLSGGFSNQQFQVGATGGETIGLTIGSIDPLQIPAQIPAQITDGPQGTLADIDVTTLEGAQAAVEIADAALNYIQEQRSQLGASQNQLESTISNLANSRINTLSAESEISDLDYAEETANLNRIKLLGKARSFARAQANASAERVADLLK